MGDPAKMLMLEVVLDEYKTHGLVENAATTGKLLQDGIEERASKYEGMIGRVRGSGCFLAWSVNNTQTRDAMVGAFRQKGVMVGGCGAYSIRLRPSMVFGQPHAEQFLRVFSEVMDEVEIQGEPSDWNTKDPRNIVDVNTGKQGAFHSHSMDFGAIEDGSNDNFKASA
jgi:4-aminobutyrate aminotransferase/(S)-3-amino-2-methylpropionate transaminase